MRLYVLYLLTNAQIEASCSELNNSHSYDIQVRLGKRDDPLLLVYARQLLEQFG
jgi:hypothetical protein